MRLFLLLFLLITVIEGCGVKADPVPPESPVEIGRGAPLYKGEPDDWSPARARPVKEETSPNSDSEEKEQDVEK